MLSLSCLAFVELPFVLVRLKSLYAAQRFERMSFVELFVNRPHFCISAMHLMMCFSTLLFSLDPYGIILALDLF